MANYITPGCNTMTQRAYYADLDAELAQNKGQIKAANDWVEQKDAQTSRSPEEKELTKKILGEFGPFLPDLRKLALKEAKKESLSLFERLQLAIARILIKENFHPQSIRSQAYIMARDLAKNNSVLVQDLHK